MYQKHAVANHNLGTIKLASEEYEEALVHFKVAVEAELTESRYWESYINALIQTGDFNNAKTALAAVRQHNCSGDTFTKLQNKINDFNNEKIESQMKTQSAKSKLNIKQTLKLAQKKLKMGSVDTAKQLYKEILDKYPKNQSALKALKHIQHSSNADLTQTKVPDKLELQNIIELYNARKFEIARERIEKLLLKFPTSAISYNLHGLILFEFDYFEDALKSFQRALELQPNYADVLANAARIYRRQNKQADAISACRRALKIDPNHVNARNNIALSLVDVGQYEEAIDHYKKILHVASERARTYFNMGIAFKEKGDLGEAEKSYRISLSVQPNNSDAYNNLGIVLNQQGKLEDAAVAYRKAIICDPENSKAWENIRFPLQSLRLRLNSNFEPQAYFPKGDEKYQVQLSTLEYVLNIGSDRASEYYKKALKALDAHDNHTLKPIKNNSGDQKLTPHLPEKVVALVHWGRSGTGLLHSLVDNHAQISTLPSIYFSEYFDQSIWRELTSSGRSSLIQKFIQKYDVLFDANSNIPIKSKGSRFIRNIGQLEGMHCVGEGQKESLNVDRKLFENELLRLLDTAAEINAFSFFQLVHIAVDRAIGDFRQKDLIFYHIHNPDVNAQLNFKRLVPNTSWLIMVRQPLQACESWLGKLSDPNDYTQIIIRIITMLYEIDHIIYQDTNVLGMRLEDLKENPKETLTRLCKWMGVEENLSLYEMTMQGKRWWGDPSSPDFLKDGMQPFGTTSISRKIGSIFSERDQYILNTLFYPFSVRFKYDVADPDKFKRNLKTIRPMLNTLFDFEKDILDRSGLDNQNFTQSGPYKYFRTMLLNRWNVLNEFGTYPNMIVPLKI